MMRKRTEEEEKLLKLLQGMKQDGFTTWCEQMLHALNTSANNSSSSLDGRLLSFHVVDCCVLNAVFFVFVSVCKCINFNLCSNPIAALGKI